MSYAHLLLQRLFTRSLLPAGWFRIPPRTKLPSCERVDDRRQPLIFLVALPGSILLFITLKMLLDHESVL